MIDTGAQQIILPQPRRGEGGNHFTFFSDVNVSCTTTARTLDSYYQFHKLIVSIKTPYPVTDNIIKGTPLPIVNKILTDGSNVIRVSPFEGGGLWYDDGTNRFMVNKSYELGRDSTDNDLEFTITQDIIRHAGTIYLPATKYEFRAEILSPSSDYQYFGGSGGGGIISGYFDIFQFDSDGALLSSDTGTTIMPADAFYRLGA